jgi:hypothetical protein
MTLYFYFGKKVRIKNYESVCILALVIRHANCIIFCVVLPCVASLALPYFPALSHKRHDFPTKEKLIGHKMYVLIFSTNFCLKYFPFYEEFSEILPQVHIG